MAFELPNEVLDVKMKAREFVEKELISLEKEWPHHTDEVPREEKVDLGKKAKGAGILGPGRPKEFGGLGLGNLGSVVVLAELSRTTPGFSTFFDVGFPMFQEPFPIFYQSSDYIKDKYLWPVLREGNTYCMMMSEPQSGSDFSGMLTNARKDGNNYILNGVKIFPTSFSWANFIVVWAILADEKGTLLFNNRGKHMITTFIVDIDNPDLNVISWIDVLGIDREPIVEIKDCVVPSENMLGEPGQGMNVGMGQMNRARLGWGAASVGCSERCLELAVDYARKRMAFGRKIGEFQAIRKIGEFQAIQWMLADSYAELEAMRQLLYHTAWESDKHGDLQQASAQMRCATIKMFCLERALNIVDRCMQIHGGIGMTDEFPFEYLHRQLKAGRAAEGTPQIMRYIIASGLLGRDVTRFRPKE